MRTIPQLLFFLLYFAFPLFSNDCHFISYTLEQAEFVAMQNNKDICKIWQLYGKSKQGRLESISKWMPEITLISQGYQTQKKLLATGTRSAFMSQFYLTQSVFSPDRYYNVKISSLEVQYLKFLLEAVMIDVLFNVRVSYYQVILDYENVETAKKNVELLTRLAIRMQKNYEIGTTILLNVNQSKVATANATSFYYQSIKQLEIDKDIFTKILGYNPGEINLDFPERKIPIDTISNLASKVNQLTTIFSEEGVDGPIYRLDFPEIEEKLLKTLFTPQEIDWWEQIAFYYRPDLRSKFAEVNITKQEVHKEQGTYLPSVVFEANYGGSSTNIVFDPSSKFTNQKMNWAIGLSLNWLLFDSFGREYRINQARLERNAKKCEYYKGIQTTYEEVRRQIFTISESIASFITAEGNVKLAEQTLDLANKQLEIGYITVFDYQIVVNNLIEAMYIRNKARFELIAGYYGLLHASGIDLAGCEN